MPNISRNFDAMNSDVITAAGANVEFPIAHGLAKPPKGYLVYRRNQNASLYESGTPWTPTLAYFKSDVGGAQFLVLFLG